MLINLSNHPHWIGDQLEMANKLYGSVFNIPFPDILPEWDTEQVKKEAERYMAICIARIVEADESNNAIHLMGESTFCFLLAQMLLKQGYHCIVSTTERIVEEKDGKKTSTFQFKRFRHYQLI